MRRESQVSNHTCRITCLPSCKIAARTVVAQVDGAHILGLSFETMVRLSAVGSADADPGVAHLLIVYLRIVDHHIEAQPLHR